LGDRRGAVTICGRFYRGALGSPGRKKVVKKHVDKWGEAFFHGGEASNEA